MLLSAIGEGPRKMSMAGHFRSRFDDGGVTCLVEYCILQIRESRKGAIMIIVVFRQSVLLLSV